MSLVLDSSATLAWIYPDEDTEAATTIYSLVVASGAWVSSLWRLEIANSLQVGIRRGRIDRAFRDAVLADLMRLAISVDPETSNTAWTATAELADRFRLTLYDAAYLELAQRRSLPPGRSEWNWRRRPISPPRGGAVRPCRCGPRGRP